MAASDSVVEKEEEKATAETGNQESSSAISDRPKKKSGPGKWILSGVVLFVIFVSVIFKIVMDNSYKPAGTIEIKEAEGLNIQDTDAVLSVRNPSVPGNEQKTGIVFYTDLRVEPACYYPLMTVLAQKGYDCFLPVAFGNQPYLNTEGAEKIIRKYPDITHWILIGHGSGCTPAARYAESFPDRVDGLVYLGGVSKADISDSSYPVLSIRGSVDSIVSQETADSYRKNDPENTDYIVIEGGNHTGFVDTMLINGDTEAEISCDRQIDLTSRKIDHFIQNQKY